jgi:serine/threonine-protein kinase RIM15
MPANSRSGSDNNTSTQRPSERTSRSSSYGPLYGPGLTPGIPKWDLTPSPIVAVGSFTDDQLENRPVAPGAELTVASVRRHVRRRLNAAKEVCDYKLREMIATITKFAEEQKGTVGRPYEDSEDYFESISDSALVDAEESDGEFAETFDGLGPRTGELFLVTS